MRSVKPLAASFLLGLVSLAGCGGADSGQDTGPQPSPPPPVAQTGGPVAIPRPDSQGQPYPICRNLHEGDPSYPGWVYCCDNDSMTQSYWTGANGNRSGKWDGSCYAWGVR